MMVIQKLKEVVSGVVENFDAIEVLYLFGSYASGRFVADSDIDVALFMDERRYKKDPLLDLKIGVILERELGCDVDVVVMNRVSPVVQHEVLRTGKRLFERSAQRRAFFELKSFKEYSDAMYYQRRRFNG